MEIIAYKGRPFSVFVDGFISHFFITTVVQPPPCRLLSFSKYRGRIEKANRTLGFLRRNLAACPLDVKESAYKRLVRPILEYGSSVSEPQSILLQDELEKVQKRAARFVTGNYVDYETGSMTGILKQLKWESLKKRRKDSRLIMLYKGLKSAASIPTNDLVHPIRRTRNHHSLAFQVPMAGTDIYKSSFFPQAIRDWSLVTDSLISASECAVDSVTKFTSLVRARD